MAWMRKWDKVGLTVSSTGPLLKPRGILGVGTTSRTNVVEDHGGLGATYTGSLYQLPQGSKYSNVRYLLKIIVTIPISISPKYLECGYFAPWGSCSPEILH